MDGSQKKFTKPVAAILPLIFDLVSPARAFWLATLLGALTLFTAYGFILLKPLFPKKLFRSSVIFFIAVLFQITHTLTHLTPFWIVSFLLLLDWDDFDPKHLAGRPLSPLVRVGIFWTGVLLLGSFRVLAESFWSLRIFEQPGGGLFCLALYSGLVLGLEKPLTPLWKTKRKSR